MKPFTISVGSLTSCLRGVVYEKQGVAHPPLHPEIVKTLDLFRTFAELGQKIQKQLYAFWLQKGSLVRTEDWIPRTPSGFTGKFDAICTIGGKTVLYEIKGAGKSFFAWVKEHKKPRPEHAFQVLTYYHLFKDAYPDLEPRILYVSRNALKYDNALRGVEVPIEISDDQFEEAKRRADLVRAALAGGELPPPTPAIVKSFPEETMNVDLSALTCRHHALCLEDENWYAKAMRELGNDITDIEKALTASEPF
ncbi:MAG: hypothetical protein Q7S89_02665 [bacterium]|nr:hypothetical protein [bacterium]